MSSFNDFVLNGRIGKLSLDVSKQETLRLLGDPQDWLGKAAIIGERCPLFERSPLWFYYGGSVGIRFGRDGKAETILLYPENLDKCPELFREWPIRGKMSLGEWRAALKQSKISFRESDPVNLNYWIVAAQTCVASGFPAMCEGKPLHGYQRGVEMLSKFSSVQLMMEACKFINMA